MATTTTTKSDSNPTPPPPSTIEAAHRWIINNEQRLRILTLRGSTTAVSKTALPGPMLHLPPGATVVDARLWERWKSENADQKDESGAIVKGQASIFLRGKIPGERHSTRRQERAGSPYLVEGPLVKNAALPLTDLEEQQALDVVEEILERKQLERLLTIERRPVIVEAIRKKVEDLKFAEAAPII